MTRFARAKGSKSSNERKPEEATSWSEMRNAMLSKKTDQQEVKLLREEPVKIDTPKKTEWASLGSDTFSESISLLKQHLGKKGNSSQENKKEKKTTNKNYTPKKKKIDSSEEIKAEKKKKKKEKKTKNVTELNESVNDTHTSEKKNKKKKESIAAESEIKVKKNGRKRKLIGGDMDSESVLPNKRKKLQKSEDANSDVPEKNKQEIDENANNKNRQKYQNSKKGIKSKHFRKENDNSRGFKSRRGKQFEGGKKFKNKNYQEGNSLVEEIVINREKIPITKFQGFYVTLEDAERLKKLRSEMIKEGIPKAKLEAAIKLERRRAEKALSRLKKSVCFHCRGHGHLLSNCPNLMEKENTGTGICYKCGSTEHSAAECKVVRGTNYQFAECFICKEQGHIARQCPDNPRGLYPQGGACRECGDVTHLRKDCPKVQAQKAEEVVTVGLRRDRDVECLDEEIASRETYSSEKKVKKSSTVKF